MYIYKSLIINHYFYYNYILLKYTLHIHGENKKIPRNLVPYKPKFLDMSYKLNELHIVCGKTESYYSPILLQPFLIFRLH